MIDFLVNFDKYPEVIATVITLIVFAVIRYFLDFIIEKFGGKSSFSQGRTNLVKRYIDFLIYVLGAIALITIWGVKKDQLFLVISSVLTVIGVAFFAQWSILSNITAGIIVFFSFPFKIGDKIKILDKECPIEAEILDIKSFYTLLRTSEGELISFPNNLLLQKGIVIVSDSKDIKIKNTDFYI